MAQLDILPKSNIRFNIMCVCVYEHIGVMFYFLKQKTELNWKTD